MRRKQASVLFSCMLAGAAVLSGCAGSKKAVEVYRENLDAVVGKATYDGFVGIWGPPDAKERISSGWVAQWHHSYGTRAVEVGRWATAHETYDEVTLTFDEDGTLRNWRVRVQR
jgi:hypothetical protein